MSRGQGRLGSTQTCPGAEPLDLFVQGNCRFPKAVDRESVLGKPVALPRMDERLQRPARGKSPGAGRVPIRPVP